MAKANNSIDVKMAEMAKDISYIKTSVIDNNIDNKKEHTDLFNLIKEFRGEIKKDFKEHRRISDSKYANKSIEKFVWIVIGAVVSALAIYIFQLLTNV